MQYFVSICYVQGLLQLFTFFLFFHLILTKALGDRYHD